MTQDLETKNLQLVQALFDATGKGDWAAAENMLTSDFSVTEAGTLPFAGTYHGRGALQELFTLVMSAAGVTGLDIQQLTAGGDRVVALLEMILGGPPEVRVPLADKINSDLNAFVKTLSVLVLGSDDLPHFVLWASF